MTWVKTQGVFTNKPWHKSWLVSESRSKSRYRSARWWLAPRLTFEYHNQTGICFTNTRNYCHRNKIYVFTSLLKQIYLQLAACARIYCTVNTACHSCCHHREFTSRRTHEQRCGDCGFEMTSQLLPLTLNERTSHRPSNGAIWDLRHDLRRDLTESRWFSFVNTTWLGPGPSLKWDSVRVQAKSWVKSQVKTVSEYGPWRPASDPVSSFAPWENRVWRWSQSVYSVLFTHTTMRSSHDTVDPQNDVAIWVHVGNFLWNHSCEMINIKARLQ